MILYFIPVERDAEVTNRVVVQPRIVKIYYFFNKIYRFLRFCLLNIYLLHISR